MELEVFVHGAMCMSYSGRCLLGDYMSGRPGIKENVLMPVDSVTKFGLRKKEDLVSFSSFMKMKWCKLYPFFKGFSVILTDFETYFLILDA